MKFAIALIILFIGLTTALEQKPLEYGMYDYHRRIGIPEANRIKKLEDEIQRNAAQNKIVGGGGTNILLVPYQAGLLITIGLISTSLCGGAVISDTRIITGAHCYNDGQSMARSFTVVLGSNFLFTGGTRINTADAVIYPGYNPWIIANDIAVIRTPSITFTLSIQPINLPSGSEIISNYVGSTARASGYGITKDGETVTLTQTINAVNLKVISNEECASIYGDAILSTHLCTSGEGGVGLCTGDTGGPLVTTINTRRILIGVGSFIAANGCEIELPSGFTRVTSYLQWIHSI